MTRPAARWQQVRLRFWCCVGEASFESLRAFISSRQVVSVDAGGDNDDGDGAAPSESWISSQGFQDSMPADDSAGWWWGHV